MNKKISITKIKNEKKYEYIWQIIFFHTNDKKMNPQEKQDKK
jgi:hypothetical protein